MGGRREKQCEGGRDASWKIEIETPLGDASISKRYHSKPDNQIKAIVILIAIEMPFSAFLILKWRGQVWSK